MDDPQRDLVADLDLEQRVLEGLDRTRHVALEDERELRLLALLELLEDRLQRRPATADRELRVALPGLPLVGDLPCHAVLGDDEEVVAGTGHGGEAQHLDRPGRTCLGDRRAGVIEHGPHAPEGIAGDHGVTDVQRAALDEDGRDRAAAAVEVRLDRHALGVDIDRRRQVQGRIGRQSDGFQQFVDADALLGGDVDEHGLAAVLLGNQAVFGQLSSDLGRVRAFLVDLVDGHHDGHVGGLRVVERLDGLRLDAVIGGDDQHDDVGGLGAAGSHGGERLVTRGVDEGDQPVLTGLGDLGVHLVGPDVLGDATCLAAHDVGLPDRVQQLGLAVVDVTHDGHHRWPDHHLRVVVVAVELQVEARQQLAVLVLGADDHDLVVELGADQLQGLVGARLGRRHHLPEAEGHLDQRAGVGVDPVGEVRERGTARQAHGRAVAPDRTGVHGRCREVVELLTPLLLALATPDRATPARTSEGAGRSAAAATAAATTEAAATGRPASGAGTDSTRGTARTTGRAAVTTAAAATGSTRPTGAAAVSAATGCAGATGAGAETAATGAGRPAGARACGSGSEAAATGAGRSTRTGPTGAGPRRHAAARSRRNHARVGAGNAGSGAAGTRRHARDGGRSSRAARVDTERVVARPRSRSGRGPRGHPRGVAVDGPHRLRGGARGLRCHRRRAHRASGCRRG